MKKTLISILIVIGICTIGISITFGFFHSEDEKNSQKDNLEYSLKYQGKEFILGSVFQEEKFGKSISYSEMQSCAFEGLDKTFTYRDYEIYTYPDKNEDRILSIYFLNKDIQTTEGLKIGDTYDKMINGYGNDFEKIGNQYSYHKGKTSIRFIIENNEISSIEYTLDIDA